MVLNIKRSESFEPVNSATESSLTAVDEIEAIIFDVKSNQVATQDSLKIENSLLQK
jgi:hypothetical protein